MDKQTKGSDAKTETKAETKTTTAFPGFPGLGAFPGLDAMPQARELLETFQAEANRAFGAWEKAASELAEKAARDPRTLAMGSAMLRSQLLAGKAMGMLWEAALAPVEAMVQVQEKN